VPEQGQRRDDETGARRERERHEDEGAVEHQAGGLPGEGGRATPRATPTPTSATATRALTRTGEITSRRAATTSAEPTAHHAHAIHGRENATAAR
jgi:hypothetical protein